MMFLTSVFINAVVTAHTERQDEKTLLYQQPTMTRTKISTQRTLLTSLRPTRKSKSMRQKELRDRKKNAEIQGLY
ncbi:hypothetical protein Bpfe_006594 [Biomphalaria pfeifferi]|uniref:Uncharacterized protein n=1 Tax=Biomphalaria pfeifferi TaxID=112525 RepID=A0AAD8C1X7_BIOPF|nr:hypothetical protein Bpfe_006594 [Biomphalaria pfeifferi]